MLLPDGERAAPAVTGNGSQNCAVAGAGEQGNPARHATQASRHRPEVEAAIDLLCEAFPKVFVRHEARRRPLKVGIHHDILAVLDGAVTGAELGLALRCYTANRVYRSRLRAGATRFDLANEPAGTVAPEHAIVEQRGARR